MSFHLSPLTKHLVDQLGALHVASKCAGVEAVEEVSAGELAELFLFGGHWSGRLHFNQIRPNARVGLLAQHLPRHFAIAVDLGLQRCSGIHVPSSRQALIEVLLIDASEAGDALPKFWGELLLHALYLSDSLEDCKRFARRVIPSDLLDN